MVRMGLAAFQKRASERHFELGALGIGAHSIVENGFAVQFRVYIIPTRKQQAFAQFRHFLRALFAGEHGNPARRGNGGAVGFGAVDLPGRFPMGLKKIGIIG